MNSMIAFPKPKFKFNGDAKKEKKNLRYHKDNTPGRVIPKKSNNHILIATWNIANLGLQKRRDVDYELLAEIISWFDLVGIQEVYDNLKGLREVQRFLPKSYRIVFNDKAGNNERAAFVYDSDKISELEMIGEVAVPPSDAEDINLPEIDRKYKGFDRNPYFVSFQARNFDFVIANVHLFFGKDNSADRERRALEAYAVSRWADLRRKSKNNYSKNFLVLGDFNLPKVEPSDLIYKALKKRGLQRPMHSTKIASNISDDKDYDQIFFFPGATKQRFTGKGGVFDFDGGVFPELWDKLNGDSEKFRSYLKYYLSDHRPLWAQFNIK